MEFRAAAEQLGYTKATWEEEELPGAPLHDVQYRYSEVEMEVCRAAVSCWELLRAFEKVLGAAVSCRELMGAAGS